MYALPAPISCATTKRAVSLHVNLRAQTPDADISKPLTQWVDTLLFRTPWRWDLVNHPAH
eukprot:5008154-Prorocentrum_lima.AAC.1